MLHRVSIVLCIIALGLTAHLAFQKQRSFDKGCWGFLAEPVSGPSDCQNKRLAKLDRIYGLPTTSIGLFFFLVVGGLSGAQLVTNGARADMLRTVTNVTVAAGMAHAGYFFYYQAAVAKAYCPLCIATNVLTAAIFILHIVPYRAPENRAACSDASGASFIGKSSFAGLALLSAVLAINYDDTPKPEASPGARLDVEAWIAEDTPYAGARGGVSVIAFLDPNCGPCVTTFQTLMDASEKHRSSAAFFIIPRFLFKYSLLQTEALEVSKSGGKYFDLWRLMFEKQQKGGMDVEEISDLFTSLGMPVDDLAERLAATKATVTQRRDMAVASGILSTPTIYVDGEKLVGKSPEAIAAAIKSAAKKRAYASARSKVD